MRTAHQSLARIAEALPEIKRPLNAGSVELARARPQQLREVCILAHEAMVAAMVALNQTIPRPFSQKAAGVRQLIDLVASGDPSHERLLAALGRAEPDLVPLADDPNPDRVPMCTTGELLHAAARTVRECGDRVEQLRGRSSAVRSTRRTLKQIEAPSTVAWFLPRR